MEGMLKVSIIIDDDDSLSFNIPILSFNSVNNRPFKIEFHSIHTQFIYSYF